jgi:hypothetical protein
MWRAMMFEVYPVENVCVLLPRGQSLRGAYCVAMPSTDFVTEREYLKLERQSEFRSEYLHGRIIAKAPSNRRHNLVVGNFSREINSQLRGRPCEAYTIAMRLKVHSGMSRHRRGLRRAAV